MGEIESIDDIMKRKQKADDARLSNEAVIAIAGMMTEMLKFLNVRKEFKDDKTASK